MKFRNSPVLRSVMLVGLGAAIGSAGGVAVYRKLHPPMHLRVDGSGTPGSRTLAPPLMLPEGKPVPAPVVVPVAASPDPVKEVPPVVAATLVPEVVVSKPPEVVVSKSPDPEAARPPEVVASKPQEVEPVVLPAAQEFFGIPVGPAAGPPGAISSKALLRLRLMKDRCVAGFDAKSSVLDFSGWTKALSGELTYQPGHPVETARGSVTADPTTLDTGDADRDKELRDEHLEAGKFPRMAFDITVVKMTSAGTVDMSGTMEFHGVKKDVTIPCTFKLRLDGFAYVAGDIKVKMSDFGIKPPVKLGIIKVEDEIRIWFEIWAEPVKEDAK